MPLPLERDQNYSDGDNLPHTTVLGLMDGVVGRGHGLIWQHFPLVGDLKHSAWTVESLNIRWWTVVANAFVYYFRQTLPLAVGSRIHRVRYYCQDIAPGTNGDGFIGSLTARDPLTGWASTALGSQASAKTGLDQSVDIDLSSSPHTILADKPVELLMNVNGTSTDLAGGTMILYPVYSVQFDKP